MTNKQPIPKFATEAEEAEWWYEQRDRLSERAEAALANGELKPRRLRPSRITGNSMAIAAKTSKGPEILKLSYVDMGTRCPHPRHSFGDSWILPNSCRCWITRHYISLYWPH